MTYCEAIELPSQVRPVDLPSRGFAPTAHIQLLVALSYGISPEYMKSTARERKVAWPRQVAMYLTRDTTHRSLPSIGKSFGGRDHSTVIHAIKAVKGRMASDPLLRADVEVLRERIAQDIAEEAAKTHHFLCNDVSASSADSGVVKTPA